MQSRSGSLQHDWLFQGRLYTSALCRGPSLSHTARQACWSHYSRSAGGFHTSCQGGVDRWDYGRRLGLTKVLSVELRSSQDSTRMVSLKTTVAIIELSGDGLLLLNLCEAELAVLTLCVVLAEPRYLSFLFLQAETQPDWSPMRTLIDSPRDEIR